MTVPVLVLLFGVGKRVRCLVQCRPIFPSRPLLASTSPASRPRDTLGTVWDTLGMFLGPLRTLPGRSGEALGRSRDALGISSEQYRSPWARFWTKSALNAIAQRPAEPILVNVGMSRGSPDVRSIPFLLMFCLCRAICASQAPRTAKPQKNILFELEN